jgi:hypothetical protein
MADDDVKITSRFDALRAWSRLRNDPDFVKNLLAGDIEARNAKAEIDAYLHSTGGPATGKELSITEFSAPEA